MKHPSARAHEDIGYIGENHLTDYLMILPSLLLISLFVYVPLYTSITKSFTDWNAYKASNFVGLQNFYSALNNQYFMLSLKNILIFVLMIVPAGMVLSFLFAHAVKNVTRGASGFVKTVIYIPSVIGGVVISMMGSYLFNYNGGLINFILLNLGQSRIAFTNSIFYARLMIVLCTLWGGLGYNTLVMLAGINNIPDTYYESARLDGANGLQRMIYITIPSMKNLFVLILIGYLSGTLQMFDLPNMMTGGGPLGSTTTPILHIYATFVDFSYSMGYVVAASLMIMLIIAAFNIIVFKMIRSEKSMDD